MPSGKGAYHELIISNEFDIAWRLMSVFEAWTNILILDNEDTFISRLSPHFGDILFDWGKYIFQFCEATEWDFGNILEAALVSVIPVDYYTILFGVRSDGEVHYSVLNWAYPGAERLE